MVEASHASHSRNTLLYVFAVLYLLVLAVVARVAYQKKRKASSDTGELHGHFGGAFGAPLLVLTTFSTVYSGFTVTGIPSEAYRRGFFSLRWIGATLSIVTAMLLFYPRLRRIAVERGYESPNDFVTDRHRSKRLRILCAVCSVVPLVIYITAQTVSFAAVVSGLTLQVVPRWVTMLLFALVTLFLEKLGGMNSVVLTDAVQSAIMIAAFLVVPWVLGADFGFIPKIAGKECDTLAFVAARAASALEPHSVCTEASGHTAPPGCVPSGCLRAVRPEFFDYPSRADQAGIFWFFFNMLAASLQPHMIQRAYIAADDNVLKVVLGSLLVAPFLAQPPGIVMGLTKAAFDPAWPDANQEATAFSGLADQLMARGPFEYFLVTTMTCSTLAAIMSTADSALMGASSVVSMDLFRGSLVPSASAAQVVRVGELNSAVVMLVAVILGLGLSVSQFSSLIVFQNGLLMQLLPTFGLSLYCDIPEIALTSGISFGLLILLVLKAFGNPLDPIVPPVNVSVLANFLAVLVLSLAAHRGRTDSSEVKRQQQGSAASFRECQPLSLTDIHELMSGSKEPDKVVITLMLLFMVLAVPFYRAPGTPESDVWGLPLWGFIQCLLFAAVFGLGLLATASWTTHGCEVSQTKADPKDKLPNTTTEEIPSLAKCSFPVEEEPTSALATPVSHANRVTPSASPTRSTNGFASVAPVVAVEVRGPWQCFGCFLGSGFPR